MKFFQKLLTFLFGFVFWTILVTILCALILFLATGTFMIYKLTEGGWSILQLFTSGLFFVALGIYIFMYFATWYLQLMVRFDDSPLKLEYSKMLSPIMTLPRNIFKTLKSSF